jgi:gamma-glutamyltranspeptidase/glutathione hydrolase
MGMRGVVASAHPLASLAGLDMLRRGGTAIDAAIAANAALNVTQPHMCGVGGDLFMLVKRRGESPVEFLNASGRASASAMPDECARRAGTATIPFRGPLSVLVPGCVDGWAAAWDRHGRLPWDSLFGPAISLASDGHPASGGLARALDSNHELLAGSTELGSVYLVGGSPVSSGTVVVQRDLAETLRRVASEGRDGFYRGFVANRIADAVQAGGGLLTGDDLAGNSADWGEPVSIGYGNRTVHVTGDNSQGVVALVALRAFGVITAEREPEDGPHTIIELVKQALSVRARISDPTFASLPHDEWLSDDFAGYLASRVGPRAAVARLPADHRDDTTGLVVIDAEGTMVSVIQSIYAEFGSGVVAPGTGVVLQNRGAQFSLDPRHVNVIAPGKRTFHTLMSSLVTDGDEPVLGVATMGAAGQAQIQFQILTAVLDRGCDVQEAIELPRWIYGDIYEKPTLNPLRLEKRFDPTVVDQLRQRGHAVEILGSWDDQMGHAQAAARAPDSAVVSGGADPRGDGYALAW